MIQEELLLKMIEFDSADAKRIQHFIKVYTFAKTIGINEKLSSKQQLVLELAAILHDIGIHRSEELYGDTEGWHQEQEGEPLARKMLQQFDLNKAIIERVCFLVANHHTWSAVDDIDFQILIEADFLVNAYEDNYLKSELVNPARLLFKTKTGKLICSKMFDIDIK